MNEKNNHEETCMFKKLYEESQERIEWLELTIERLKARKLPRKNRPGTGAHYKVQFGSMHAKVLFCLYMDGAINEKTGIPRKRVEQLMRKYFTVYSVPSIVGRLSEATGMEWSQQSRQQVSVQKLPDGTWGYRHQSQLDPTEEVRWHSKPTHWLTRLGASKLRRFSELHPEEMVTSELERWLTIAPQTQIDDVKKIIEIREGEATT